MTDTDTHASESQTVQLTRMEGVLNLMNYKLEAVLGQVARHEIDIVALKATTQTLHDEAIAERKTTAAIAAAMKDAEDARHARSEARWTPWQRVIFACGGIVAVIGTFFGARSL